MTKLTVNRLQELAASMPQLSTDAQCNIKGGCSSCEDTRRPPKKGNNNNGGGGQN
jgi:hypothetical protein